VEVNNFKLTAYIAIKIFDILVQAFVESQQSLHFEIFRAESTLERTFDAVDDEMISHVLGCLEPFLASFEVAANVEFIDVSCLVSLHVRFLNECAAADDAS
jgi:hypothetical protein